MPYAFSYLVPDPSLATLFQDRLTKVLSAPLVGRFQVQCRLYHSVLAKGSPDSRGQHTTASSRPPEDGRALLTPPAAPVPKPAPLAASMMTHSTSTATLPESSYSSVIPTRQHTPGAFENGMPEDSTSLLAQIHSSALQRSLQRMPSPAPASASPAAGSTTTPKSSDRSGSRVMISVHHARFQNSHFSLVYQNRSLISAVEGSFELQLILGKLKNIWTLRQMAKIEGQTYKTGEYVVSIGVVEMGSSPHAVLIEIEHTSATNNACLPQIHGLLQKLCSGSHSVSFERLPHKSDGRRFLPAINAKCVPVYEGPDLEPYLTAQQSWLDEAPLDESQGEIEPHEGRSQAAEKLNPLPRDGNTLRGVWQLVDLLRSQSIL
ncbi:uncharacterized protein BJ171DRAFT_501800 [Polychytrium aggregatum]|uniref:uncharacterized protein n=1 Tax=Polychytrium aggregatum TaxID=110093 RepID=UPI0022FE1983|nr:uncharacterized protein BJ171DRAFT_501800 [Polychytrium aggregatum]KAI9205334.1 hypothetical protein BJ171DRAFT_501800 [Polychytrium aggregatum]